MKKKPLTKRQLRDGITSTPQPRTGGKPTRTTPHRPQHEQTSATQSRHTNQHNLGSRPTSANTPRPGNAANTSPRPIHVRRAKKLAVRQPNQKIRQQVHDLREQRLNMNDLAPVRVQKALAASGVGSRREMEQWISQGLVQINHKKAQLGDKIQPGDEVSIRGNPVNIKWPDRLPRIVLYYKQEGEIVSRNDPQGRVSIFDRLPQTASSRWVAIGRLDINTCGLLIITTSGELVNRFAHPSFEVEREYAVRVLGELDTAQKAALTQGVMLDDGLARIERLSEQGGEGANKWYNVTLKEGRNREVRRLFDSQGLTVSRLVRVRFGPIQLPARLRRGQYYELNSYEVAEVMRWAALPVPGRR